MKYKIKNINDYLEKDINYFYNIIYNEKRKKIDKYISTLSKKRSIIGDILLSDLLKENYNIDYKKLNFKINRYGKPYIKDINIYFNISHSFDYIITAVSDNKIGIDIEQIRKTSINTINYFATNNEKKYILASSNNIEERLFEIYTLKEAYFKMKGKNLKNIKNVEFEIKNNNILCSDKNVKMNIIRDINGYIIATCEKK